MNRIYKRRDFEESFRAYTNAGKPTAQLTQDLCARFAQMVSDDTGESVYVGLMGFRVVREPTTNVRRMQA